MRALLLAALFAGCAGASTPAPATAEDVSTGRLHPDALRTATEARSVEKLVIETRADGTVEEISVYHRDEGRIPAAVKALAAERFPGSHSVRFETEIEDAHGAVYEVELETADARQCEIQATDAGALLYTECRLTRGDLPAAVVSAVDRLVPSNEFVEAEKKETADEITFSVEARADGVVHYVRLTESGEVRSHAVEVPAVVHVPVR